MYERGDGLPHGSAKIVLDFLNTVACPACRAGDALDPVGEPRGGSARRLPIGALPRPVRGRERLRRFRAAVRELVEASIERRAPDPRSLETLNAAARRYRPRSALRWSRTGWTRVDTTSAGGEYDRVAGRVAIATIELLTGPARMRLKRCHGLGCEHFLYGRTKTQLWCSPSGCGNRARVARHYRLTRGRAAKSRRRPAPVGSDRRPGAMPASRGRGQGDEGGPVSVATTPNPYRIWSVARVTFAGAARRGGVGLDGESNARGSFAAGPPLAGSCLFEARSRTASLPGASSG
jgi:predicted RNA-binding Zn ribbon-like protein